MPDARRFRRRLTVVAPLAAAGSLLLTALPAAAITGGAGVGDPYFPDDGNSGYDVTHYDVHLGYDPAHPDHLDGDTTVTARATEDLDRFDLDLKGFRIGTVTVNGRPAREVTRSGAHELVVTPAGRLPAGRPFTVRVTYAGTPDHEGWHTLQDGGADAIGEPHGATSWFPSNDHPSDKATFGLTVTVPDGWTAIGNGVPGRTTSGGGRTTYRWSEDRPMATYLATVAIDRFTVQKYALPDGTPVIDAYSPGALTDPATPALQAEIISFLSSKFGPYPFDSAGGIAINGITDEGTPLALETQGRPTYSGALFDVSMVHEITHQWFGDSVSFTDWRDGCIAECFAQYANQLWDEHLGADLDTGFYQWVLEGNRDNPTFWDVPLYDAGPGTELDPALYDKGSLMMHALRRYVGDDTFFATLKRWTADHAYGNASWPAFEKLAAQVSGKDLNGFFRAWAHSTVIPPQKYLYPGSLAKLRPGAH
ncbi:M1 family metallopeptidase [Peterkaempfera griseoplana]|uniref:M1 family metallopeptidase n=1 Tax=Peterkaempfera griseoplana TaxID=66896 RepID=UPI0006E2E4BA|nr:M1 family metallopeptidase [Peterkaempfera griseoplana]